MKTFIARLIISLIIFAALASAETFNNTDRKKSDNAGELFVKTLSKAPVMCQYQQGQVLRDRWVIHERASIIAC